MWIDCAYFSEPFLCADGVDDHTISDASHHCQHVEANAHRHTCRQLDVVANSVRHIIQIFAVQTFVGHILFTAFAYTGVKENSLLNLLFFFIEFSRPVYAMSLCLLREIQSYLLTRMLLFVAFCANHRSLTIGTFFCRKSFMKWPKLDLSETSKWFGQSIIVYYIGMYIDFRVISLLGKCQPFYSSWSIAFFFSLLEDCKKKKKNSSNIGIETWK